MFDDVLASLLYNFVRLKAVRAKREFLHKASRCADTQRGVLLAKLRYSADTEYGRLYRFNAITSTNDYRKAVPIVDYRALSPHVMKVVEGKLNILFPPEEKLLMFAMTSGTTATPKYVPVTGRYIKELARGNFIWAAHLLSDYPSTIDHKILHIVSPSRENETPRGVPCGAATGLVAESQQRIAHLKYALRPAVFRISDYHIKYYCIIRLAIQQKISLLIAANPSTLVSLGQCLERNAGDLIKDLHGGTLGVSEKLEPDIRKAIEPRLKRKRKLAARLERVLSREGRLLPRDVWPELAVIACWTGGTLTPYLDLVRYFWGEKPLRDPGLIASEGRMTIPMRDGEAGGVLDVESHFYEFVPYGEKVTDGNTLLAHELEEGEKYCIILSTSSGFFRYNISDVVQVCGWFGDTPVLKFLHKGSRISSLTGEKISEHQVVQAFQACERELDFAVPQFTVCPGWDVPPFYYILLEKQRDGLFEGKEGEELLSRTAERFDDKLKELNIEYKNKRDSGRLSGPRVQLLERGSFEQGRAAHIERNGGRLEQYKHPYLSPLLDHCKNISLVGS